MPNSIFDDTLPVGIILQATSGFCNYPITIDDITETDVNVMQYNIAEDFNVLSNEPINIYRVINPDRVANSAIYVGFRSITHGAIKSAYNPTIAMDTLDGITGHDMIVIYKDVTDLSGKEITFSVCRRESDMSHLIFEDGEMTFRQLYGYSEIDFTTHILFVSDIEGVLSYDLIEYSSIVELDNFYVKLGDSLTIYTDDRDYRFFRNYSDAEMSTTDFSVADSNWMTTLDIATSKCDVIFNTEIDNSLNPINNHIDGGKYVVNYTTDFMRYFQNFHIMIQDYHNTSFYNRKERNINIFGMYRKGGKYVSIAGLYVALILNNLYNSISIPEFRAQMKLLCNPTISDANTCKELGYNFVYDNQGLCIIGNGVLSKYKNLNKFADNILLFQIKRFLDDFINNNESTVNDLYVYDRAGTQLREFVDGVENIESVEIRNGVRIKLRGVLEEIIFEFNLK